VKIVLLFSQDANQRALAHRIAGVSPVTEIIACKPAPSGRAKGAAQLGRLVRGIAGLPLRKAWFGMLGRYEREYPEFPIEPILSVTDINDHAVAMAIDRIAPDLALVSGTNLLRQPLIDLISRTGRIMNLHTGISPYIKGGPNCTNWCLATGRFDLIGNTVMWIDRGIDSGNLVATEQTPLEGTESLAELHVKVMDHAHTLVLRCIERFVAGAPLPDVPQAEIGSGRLFLGRHWNAAAAARAVLNFYLKYRRAGRHQRPLRLVNPENA
jgi:methionyl-tRNA formyltransferase